MTRKGKSPRDIWHEFADERCPDYVNFLSRWYARKGRHDIYCKDLDWLDRPELEPIVEFMTRHKTQMAIFVRGQNAEVCRRLSAAGVQIYLVPEVARSEMKMLLLRPDGDDDDEIIVFRRKRPGSQMVRLVHSQDHHIIGLAEDLFTLYRARPTSHEPYGDA